MSGVGGGAAVLGIALIFYLLGATLLGARLFLGQALYLTLGRAAALLGVVFHFGAIGLRCITLRHPPFTTPEESLSLLAWLLALAYLGIELFGWRSPTQARFAATLGPFALGLAFLMVVGAALAERRPVSPLQSALLGEQAISLHIVATLAAFGLFALAFCCAALFLIVHGILKSKHGLLWMKRLPPLVAVDQIGFTLIAIGFPLLTLGILSGMLRAAGGGLEPGWLIDSKTLLALALWAIYGVYLLARILGKWPPIRTAGVLLLGLPLALLVLFVPSATHQFG